MIASLLAAATFGAAAADDPWRRDHDALLQGLARNYANFEDLLVERRLDLPALVARDRAALAAARSDGDRRRVFERLLRDLRDPHVRIEWAPSDEGGPGPFCAPDTLALGVRPGLAFASLPGWTALDGPAPRLFFAGVLTPQGGVPVGVLRLSVFIESAYEPACRHAAMAMRRSTNEPCDDGCTEQRDRLAADFLNEALRRTVQAFQTAGARRIAVDLTHNPGGSDWSESVARLLAGPMASARIAVLRHPAWLAWIDRRLPEATPDEAVALRRLRPQVAQGCDLSAAWADRSLATGQRPLPCSTLVDDGLYTLGLTSTGPSAPAATALPLYLLIDDETHSAAEQFAAMLQDQNRATLLGSVTAGAACGTYTGGEGTAFRLPASGARVHVPDCVRLRADGSNERRGITPDRWIPWAPSDSGFQRAAKAAAALISVSTCPAVR